MFQKYIYKMLVAVHVVFAVVMVMILIQYPNMYNIDFAGHVASCRFFDIYGLHAVNLQWFLGYVTNLFYPPLEDMLCASVHRVTGWGYIQSFQLYISVISMLYVYLGCRLTRHRDDYVIKSLWLVLRFGYIWMYKAGLIYMQGMGMMDAAFTGLTSQILGGCFLLWLIDWMLSHPSPVGEGIEGEVITTKQSITPILSLIGIILSHLVLAPIGVGLYSLSMILSRQYRKLMVHLGIVVVATVWRWLPFVVYKSTMASSTIIKDVPVYIGLVVVGLVGMVFFLSTNPSQSSLCQGRGGMVTLVALITITLGILMPSYIYMILGTNYLPAFHYYRFLSPGLLLGLIACMSMLSSMAISKK